MAGGSRGPPAFFWNSSLLYIEKVRATPPTRPSRRYGVASRAGGYTLIIESGRDW
jgi:hypothetical protein